MLLVVYDKSLITAFIFNIFTLQGAGNSSVLVEDWKGNWC